MIGQMAKDLGVTTRFIAAFAQGASYAYKTYTIPKKDGGFRRIDHPSKPRPIERGSRYLTMLVCMQAPDICYGWTVKIFSTRSQMTT